MKKQIIIILLSFILASCGTLKKNVHKTETDEKTTTTEETATTRTITEKVDTTIVFKADTTKAQANIDSLRAGYDVVTETQISKVIIHYDTVHKKIYVTEIIKSKKAVINIDKTTIDKTNSKTKTESEKKEKNKDKTVQRTSGLNLFWLGMACGILLIFGLRLLYKYLKTIYPFLP